MRVVEKSERVAIIEGDCLDVLRKLKAETIHAIVTDPPYGLSREPDMVEVMKHWLAGDDYVHKGNGFMGKSWDSFVPGPAVWKECLRVLKPGGYLLSFAGSRTFDLMTLAIRLGGFEIRDSIAWLYGSGFPKSMDVSKAIDKAAGATREVIGLKTYGDGGTFNQGPASGRSAGHMGNVVARPPSVETTPATPEAEQWQGWGTALKPAFEPIIVARKPIRGTVVANVLEHGTGALNIDGCRIEGQGAEPGRVRHGGGTNGVYADDEWTKANQATMGGPMPSGRWPANVILDEDQAAALDEQSGRTVSKSGGKSTKALGIMNDDAWTAKDLPRTGHDDTGGASRFMYVAKAPKKERPVVDGVAHPTVKPLALMRWLVRLVTPPDGFVLDPFAGSGTTAEAALLEGFKTVVIEKEAEHIPLIQLRVRRVE